MVAPSLDSPRKHPRQERAMATVDAILRATAHILKAQGYEACSTNAVAQKAGVSIGSLYQYFPSKEALVVALAERHAQHGYELLLQSIRDAGQTMAIEKTIRHYIGAMVRMHTHDPELHRVLIEQVGLIKGAKSVMSRVSHQAAALVQAWIHSNQKHFRRMDSEIATYVLVTSVEAVTHLRLLDRPPQLDTETLIDELSELVIRYLGLSTHRSSKRRAR